jgi:hypothetical protein
MKLTTKALSLVNVPRIRIRIAVALEVTEQSIIRYIRDNNDELTKAAAMKVIREETGLSDEEILEAESEKAA